MEKYENGMLPINIQLFAEGDEDPKDPTPTEPTPPANPDPTPPADPADPKDPADPSDGEKPPVFSSVEDYNKVIQSTASKAKNDILKEIGYGSIAEIKDAISKGQNVQQLVDDLAYTRAELDTMRLEKKNADDALLLNKVGVAPEFAEQFLRLVDSDVSGKSREEVALDLKNAFLTGALFQDIQVPGVVIGSGKTNPPNSDEALQKVREAAGLK